MVVVKTQLCVILAPAVALYTYVILSLKQNSIYRKTKNIPEVLMVINLKKCGHCLRKFCKTEGAGKGFYEFEAELAETECGCA